MEYVRKCAICGKRFTTTHKLYLYCSPECRADARRKRNRGYLRALRARNASARNEKREAYDEARAAEHAERARKAKEDFEKRVQAGDVHALMLREKAQHGNSSRKYWQLFADCLIEKAEAAGKIDRTTVNGVSIYDDDFAGLVLDSIKTRGVMMIERNR